MGLKESGLRGSLRNVSVGIDAIPDGVVSYYDPKEESVGSISTVSDQQSEFDLSGEGEIIDDGIGGEKTLVIDDSNSFSNDDINITTEPFGVVCVFRLPNTQTRDFLFDSGTELDFGIQDHDSSESLRPFRGGSGENLDDAPSTDTDASVLVLEGYDTNKLRLEVDGTEFFNGELSAGDLDGLVLGDSGVGEDRSIDVEFGEFATLKDASREDFDALRDEFASIRGISID